VTAERLAINRNATSLLQWVWRSYFRTALIPLLLVEVVFIAVYLTTNQLATRENIAAVRSLATDELRRIAQREAVVIQKQLESVSQLTDLYRRQTVLALNTPFDPGLAEKERYAYSPEGTFYTTRDNGQGAVFYSGFVPVGPEQRQKVWRMAQLIPLMRDIEQIHPLVVQIYFNTFDSLNLIYPYFDVRSQYPPRMDIPAYNFYYEADAAHNPGRGVVWTDVYVDPAGQGWMISCIAPAYRADVLEGVVGLDVTVATITDTILNLAIPWNGYGILVSKTGTLLALPRAGEDDWGLKELTTHAYTDAIRQDTFKPEEFNIYRRTGFTDLRNQTEGVAQLELKGAQLAAWATIPETGWKLVVLVRESNIYAQASELSYRLFVIGAWMVGGIILFYMIFFMVLYRRARNMARFIAEPLETIDALVERIGQGDYRQQAPGFKVLEIQHTAEGLVAMGGQLGEVNQSLRITQQEAEQARDAALESSRLKSEFLAAVSHEIRTPMNGILGMLDLLLDTPLEAQQKEFGQAALESGRLLLKIINDILDFSKIEAGKIELNQATFSPLALVEGAADVLAPRAHEKRLELMSFVSPQVPSRVSGDEGRLRQVLLNLLSNAVKFTERGEITIRCELDRVAEHYVWLRFTVTDTGIGISSAAHSRLFQPFTQVDGSAARRFGGTGLGLSISKRLLELMGGEIDVNSEEGVGSTFWFRVPLRMVEQESGRLMQLRQRGAPRVLVVDHGSRTQELLREYLTSWGMQATVTTAAAEALSVLGQAREDPFKTIVIGLDLDSSEFKQLLAGLEQSPRWATIPRLLLAGLDEKGLSARAEALKFNAYLTKPVHQSRLFDVLVGLFDQPAAPAKSSAVESAEGQVSTLENESLILLAEDNVINRKLAINQLSKLGYTAEVAENGRIAVEKALARYYRLILMDVQMPEMDGIEAMQRIRELQAKRGERSVIIAVTANAMVGDRERLLAEGMDDYQSKPYGIEQLRALLVKWLGESGQKPALCNRKSSPDS
jgi:signal transduction histidine kinase/CheY-like chemotaxis protein